MGTADRMGMVHLDGSVGHSGACGCQVFCGMRGRHQPGKPQYFPVLLKPDGYTVHGCDHNDVNPSNLSMGDSDEYQRKLGWLQASGNAREFARRRFASGLVKPTILSGLPRSLGAPALFGLDLMHLTTLNITSLILDIFRGLIQCATSDNQDTWLWAMLNGDKWTQHGSLVASMHPYLPGCFDRAPRNPAEKINSGYKSSEFLIYVFVLGPAVFRPWIPTEYWRHFCKLVAGVRRFFQTKISRKHLEETHQMMIQYVTEFELLYVQRRADRIHFVRPCLHGLIHMAELVIRKGPLPGFSQYVMERTIGNLGEEIKQDSQAYANLSERALFRCQANALKALFPELEPTDETLPRGSINLGNDYALLRALDTADRPITNAEERALEEYLLQKTGTTCNCSGVLVRRWARLRLPCGQTVRSLWKEANKPLNELRMSRNVKVSLCIVFLALYLR
jgi:hypothetical protein